MPIKQGPFYISVSFAWYVLIGILYKLSWQLGSSLILTLMARYLGRWTLNYMIIQFNPTGSKFKKLTFRDYQICLFKGCMLIGSSLFNALGFYYLNITEALLISSIKPILNILLNRLVYKEETRIIHFLAFLCCICGLLLVVQPPMLFSGGDYMLTDEKVKGLIYRVLGLLFLSIHDLTVKKIGVQVDTIYVIHVGSLSSILAFGIAYGCVDQPKVHSPACYAALLSLGLISWFEDYYYNKAYQTGPMNLTSIFEFSGVVIGFVADYFIYGKQYNTYCYIGAGIILLALFACQRSESQKQAEEDSLSKLAKEKEVEMEKVDQMKKICGPVISV